MRTAYRVLAHVVAAAVLIQAAAIAYAQFGLISWIEGGGVLDQAAIESESADFVGVGGFPLHGINGQLVIPLIGLALLVVSFFAKVDRGVRWAGIVFGLIVLQVLLGMFARGLVFLGALHGLNALALFVSAVVAARLVRGRVGAPAAGVSGRADVS